MIQTVDKTCADEHRPPVAITAASVVVLPSIKGVRVGEYAIRCIQNVGAQNVYYMLGGTGCDTVTNYNGYLASGQQLDVVVPDQVSCCCAAGQTSTISITSIRRNDLVAHQNIATGNMNV